MDPREAARYWEGNAFAWTRLSRQGWDVYRDAVNTPAFLDLLPDVAGRRGLDVGCGEGHNTRLLARRGARMWAVDVAPTFVRFAREAEWEDPCGITYAVASALQLPFAVSQFDFVTAVMSLMDIPTPENALREIHRVLRPGGFLQFSITHPCFSTPYRRLLRTAQGTPYAVEVGRYFERTDGRIERWLFSAAPAEVKAGLEAFAVPVFHRTLAEWLNALLETGFALECVAEPRADEATAGRLPTVEDTRVVAYFLHLRCRKPGTAA
ncbi:MAG TPA: class I SAM-dependent methyltransferase [Bryobacteraceae bacterium]|jgi:SAM-dependent methyltransferase|nr:class I SAM-dependent methyltransferase [Bryobacteraceae bacterium]